MIIIMICQKCGKRNATVHLKQMVNGMKKEEFLCSVCAGEKGALFSVGTDIGTDSLFEALFSAGRQPVSEARTVCPLCGASIRDIQKNGKAGCAKCYEIFGGELRSAAYRIHGSARHVGRAPGNHREEMERQAKLEELKNRQARAIEEQDFELAAKLRDEIKALNENTVATDDGRKWAN